MVNEQHGNLLGGRGNITDGKRGQTFKSLKVLEEVKRALIGKKCDGSAAGTTNSREPLQHVKRIHVRIKQAPEDCTPTIVMITKNITCGLSYR